MVTLRDYPDLRARRWANHWPWRLDIICRHGHRKGHTQQLEVLLPAADLVRLAGAQLQEVARPLGFPHQVEGLPILLEYRPVGVVPANGGVNYELPGQLHE